MAPSEPPPSFRNLTRDRMLKEMLRSTKVAGSTDWKVLVMDEFTLRAMSSLCKMADVTEEGISLVEDLAKQRQPLRDMDAVYFIQPTRTSLNRLTTDMGSKPPLYRKAHVFFSRPISKEDLNAIGENSALRSRLARPKEFNLEYITVDMQGFVSDQNDALLKLSAEEINTRDYERCIYDMAGRLATAFASINEFPAVRYRAAKANSAAGSTQRMRDLVPTRLASAVWDRVLEYKKTIKGFPQSYSCDLLILDRTVDPIAPVIHDWSYGGMCFDLLPVDGNKYEYETVGALGKPEKKTVLLDEHDPVWRGMRDLFLAEAYNGVKELFDQLSQTSKLGSGELGGKDLQNLIKALPSYTDQKEKLELHSKISASISKVIDAENLYQIGALEQGFVFGDSTSTYKELAAIINSTPDMTRMNKIRLFMIYAATHPEKLEPQRQLYWMQLMKLTEEDMPAIRNLELLGVPINEPTPQPKGLALAFGTKKQSGHVRKERKEVEEEYELNRFYPVLKDLVEDMSAEKLSRDDYPYVVEPTSSSSSSTSSASPDRPTPSVTSAERKTFSLRGKKSSGGGTADSGGVSSGINSAVDAVTNVVGSWALRGGSGADPAAPAPHSGESLSRRGAQNTPRRRGRRLVIYVIGGMTRSEIRVAHQLTEKLNREIIIGSTSLDTPAQFIEKVIQLRPN